jgi:hypothetical protein
MFDYLMSVDAARARKTCSHVGFGSTRLAKKAKPFDPNTTHLNNGLTRHDPLDPFIKQVVLG